jgi:phosphohistidine phosphatase
MELYIVRHGDAIDQADPAVTGDEMRWLTDAGRDEVALMARLLEKLDVRPDLILTSPLVRARQTAEIIAEVVGPSSGPVDCHDMAPGGSPAGVLHAIGSRGQVKRVVVSGHMPGVARLAGYLAWHDPDQVFGFRTAAICRVDLPDVDPAPGSGELRWLIPPRIARRLLRQR